MANDKPFDLAEKIFLYHTGKLDQPGRDELERQISADPTLKKLIDELKKPDLVQDELDHLALYDPQKAYTEALDTVYPVRHISPVRYWYAAAGIAIIVCFGLLFRFLLSPLTQTSQEVLITHQDTTDGIQLMLATGEHVRIDTLSFLQTKDAGFAKKDGVLSIKASSDGHSSRPYKIIVPYKKKYQVILSDGTRISLNAGSTLTFPSAFDGNERRVHLEGEAFFEVTHMPGKRFIVEAGKQQIRVYGTTFNVKAYSDEPIHYTTLVEGSISLQNQDSADELFLRPGHQAQFDQESGQTKVKSVDLAMAANWKDGWLAFDNRPMGEVLRQIGRWYNMEITSSDQSLHQVSISGKILLYPDVRDVLRKFEKLGDARFDISENEILIKHVNNN